MGHPGHPVVELISIKLSAQINRHLDLQGAAPCQDRNGKISTTCNFRPRVNPPSSQLKIWWLSIFHHLCWTMPPPPSQVREDVLHSLEVYRLGSCKHDLMHASKGRGAVPRYATPFGSCGLESTSLDAELIQYSWNKASRSWMVCVCGCLETIIKRNGLKMCTAQGALVW